MMSYCKKITGEAIGGKMSQQQENRSLFQCPSLRDMFYEILGVDALRSYLKLTCQYELHSLPNKKVSGAKGHGKIYQGQTAPGPPSLA